VRRVLTGSQYTTIRRHRLATTLSNPGSPVIECTALNEVVARRPGDFSGPAAINVYLNNTLLCTAKGDGVMVSSATGSSGYNQSAGGPILYPTMDNLIITFIASHNKTPMVVPNAGTISLTLSSTSRVRSVQVSADSRFDLQLDMGGRLDVRIDDAVLEQIVHVAGGDERLPRSTLDLWTANIRSTVK